MTKKNMLKLLERSHGELITILLDEARKLDKDQAGAEELARETFSDLRSHLEGGRKDVLRRENKEEYHEIRHEG